MRNGLLLMLGVLLVAAMGARSHADAAAPAKVCHKGKRVVRCAKAPKSAQRPKRAVDEQGPRSLTPRYVENGGGIGGGPDAGPVAATLWAKSQLGQKKWAWRCERFVEEAYGTRYEFPTALAAAKRLDLHKGTAPAGALVYFDGDDANHGWGHVGIALGKGRMISALGTVRTTRYSGSRYWRDLYLGWADAPSSWPGRIPPPPGPSIELPEATLRLTAPAFKSTVSGRIELTAAASGVSGVVFDAYYSTDPRDPSTVEWHTLGVARRAASGYVLEWDTHTVPDQGDTDLGTINIAATALDRGGQRTGTRDYRRINVDNSRDPTPTPTPTATPTVTATPTPPAARSETTGGYARTWTDYRSAGGTEGPGIEGGQAVQVSCRVEGFRVPDGNTWWYRIASPPWNDAYYASADAFYNNGATSGPLDGTPWVDEAVPTC